MATPTYATIMISPGTGKLDWTGARASPFAGRASPGNATA